MPRAFSSSEKQTIKAQLLEAGRRQFSAYGLKKTSIEELAAAASISKAGFYLFYASKEALFMDVVELEEQRFRRQVLAALDQPAATPRQKLVAVLQRAFTLWREIPVLQFFTSSEYTAIARRIPPETIQAHLESDRLFAQELVDRCRQAGIPLQVTAEQAGSLFYALFFTVLHEHDLAPQALTAAIDVLLELTAAYFLGEVEIQSAAQAGLQSAAQGAESHVTGH